MENLKHRGNRSPWGTIQDVEYITPWLCSVSTSSHGGYKVSKEYNKLIPSYARKEGGWYEEDCEYSIVLTVLENQIKESMFDFSEPYWKSVFKEKHYIETFKNWFPTEYEQFFNVQLQDGESYIKDERLFKEKNKDNWTSFTASMVSNTTLCKVWFRISSSKNIPEICLLIEGKEYDKRGRWPMVIPRDEIKNYKVVEAVGRA